MNIKQVQANNLKAKTSFDANDNNGSNPRTIVANNVNYIRDSFAISMLNLVGQFEPSQPGIGNPATDYTGILLAGGIEDTGLDLIKIKADDTKHTCIDITIVTTTSMSEQAVLYDLPDLAAANVPGYVHSKYTTRLHGNLPKDHISYDIPIPQGIFRGANGPDGDFLGNNKMAINAAPEFGGYNVHSHTKNQLAFSEFGNEHFAKFYTNMLQSKYSNSDETLTIYLNPDTSTNTNLTFDGQLQNLYADESLNFSQLPAGPDPAGLLNYTNGNAVRFHIFISGEITITRF